MPHSQAVVADDPTTRSTIIEAAKHCFAESGFKGASIKKIAAAAGVATPALIYYYFPSKVELFAAVIDDGAQRGFAPFRVELARQGTITEVMQAVADAALQFGREDPALLRLIVRFPIELQQSPELAARFQHDPLDQLWSDLLGEVRTTLLLPPEVDVAAVRELFRIWFTGLIDTIVNRNTPELRRASDIFNDLIGRALGPVD